MSTITSLSNQMPLNQDFSVPRSVQRLLSGRVPVIEVLAYEINIQILRTQLDNSPKVDQQDDFYSIDVWENILPTDLA